MKHFQYENILTSGFDWGLNEKKNLAAECVVHVLQFQRRHSERWERDVNINHKPEEQTLMAQ